MVKDMKNFFKNGKLYLIILGVIILGFFLILHFSSREDNLIYINVSDLQTKIDNQDDFILVISQTGCSHCKLYLPVLESVLKEYKISAYVINLTNLTSDEAGTFNSLVNVSGTPTTLFYKNGVETTTLNRIVGEATKTKIIERLKSLEYIK